MFGFLKRAWRAYRDIYGYAEPGTGVTVMTSPDSVLDFYRMSNVRLPLPANPPPGKPRRRARTSIWGGQGAAPIISFGPKRAGC